MPGPDSSSRPTRDTLRCVRIADPVVHAIAIVAALVTVSVQSVAPSQAPPFALEEATVRQIHAALTARAVTCAAVIRGYLDRIAAYDDNGPALRAILSVNPRAVDVAEALDRSNKTGVALRPLHCIPVILKDNFDTADMPTT